MMKIDKKVLVIGTLVLLVGLFVGNSYIQRDSGSETVNTSKGSITVYKSPNCGCCVKYIAYLKRNGFEVETVNTNDTDLVKEEHNIPQDMESCHTAVFSDYFIEGHIPIEAVNKLLAEKPQIDGIALPGMPSGSPGMPGAKKETFKIFALSDGTPSDYMGI